MKPVARSVMTCAVLAMGLTSSANDLTAAIAAPDLVFDAADGIVAVEAEHFFKQTLTD